MVVTKLDRLARSVIDARDIAGKLTRKGVTLSLGSQLLFNVLGIVAKFDSDLIRA